MDTPNDLMMREEERRKVSENHDWSKLCPDLLRKIIESLSFIDIYSAKTVCSDWYSVWKTCVKRPLCPWQITYEGKSLILFDHREDKAYTSKLLGLSEDSYLMASYGTWLLMVEPCLSFYIFNLLTCKRINLPSIESPIRGAQVRFKPSGDYGEWGHFVGDHRKGAVAKHLFVYERPAAVLWINERTGDYVVAWIFNEHYLFTLKKGDDSWWNWNRDWNRDWRRDGCTSLSYLDLAYKKSKLYLYTSNGNTNHCIKIIDFSGDYPKEDIENNPYQDHCFHYVRQPSEYILKTRIAIQESGEVLVILSLLDRIGDKTKRFFYMFKMNLESGGWERVDSIGHDDDEMLIFGHGVTIRAPVQDVGDGIKNGSICFVDDDFWRSYSYASYCGVFDLATSKITRPKRFGDKIKCQWFLPGFA